jgi:hypothetical protein
MSQEHYKLTIELKDTSFSSLIGGLEEILKYLKRDEDKIESGEKLAYQSSYDEGFHNGEYSASIETASSL